MVVARSRPTVVSSSGSIWPARRRTRRPTSASMPRGRAFRKSSNRSLIGWSATESYSAGMRYLVLTDIHANLEALDACLADARVRGYEQTLILGDVVGYGADPNAVIDRVV